MQKKLMKTNEWDDAVSWRVGCDCGDPEHDMQMWIEYDPKFTTYGFSIEFETSVSLNSWMEEKWYNKLLWRIRKAWAILRHGRVEHSATFLLSGDNIGAFEFALKEAKTKFAELVKDKKND